MNRETGYVAPVLIAKDTGFTGGVPEPGGPASVDAFLQATPCRTALPIDTRISMTRNCVGLCMREHGWLEDEAASSAAGALLASPEPHRACALTYDSCTNSLRT